MTGAGRQPVRRLVLAASLVVLVAGLGAASASEERTVLVVDVSADMWQPMRDGLPRLAAVRDALVDAALRHGSRTAGRQVAIRLIGADTAWADDEACRDTRLLRPFAPLDPDELSSSLDSLVPGGRRPLVEAVLAAVADLPPEAERGRIVLVLAGDESCGEDKARAVAALDRMSGDITLRIVGVAMPHDAAGRFNSFAPTRNTGSLSDLHTALDWALTDQSPSRPPRTDLEFELAGTALPPGELNAHVVPTGEQDGFILRRVGHGRYRGKVDPGRHTLRLVEPGSDRVIAELGGLAAEAGGSRQLRLELPARLPVTLELLPAQATPPGVTTVSWWGAPQAPLAVTITAREAPIATFLVQRPVSGESGTVDLPLPDGMRGLEVRMLEAVGNGLWRLLGRTEVDGIRPGIALDVPADAETGSVVELEWRGEAAPGDRLVLEPVDGVGDPVCVLAHRPGQVTLSTPATGGAYRVVYLEGLTGRVLASRDLTLKLVEARLDAPASARVGDSIEVSWTGPGGDHDFLTVVPSGAPEHDYRQHVAVGAGGPVPLVAPDDPGGWEVRYVEGRAGRVLARQPIEITPLDVVLVVPDRVPADRRFSVTWSGPAQDGDLITVAPAGSLPMRMLDWAPVSLGSPITLAAPSEPGHYEVRYLSPGDRKALGSAGFEVVR